jgi:ubiquitin C-terminal hydrolase
MGACGVNEGKVQTNVQFPITDFDASSMAYESDTLQSPPINDLFAVCNHEGNTTSRGHNTATCFDSHSNSWYSFDDNRVRKLSEQKFNESKAYIYFMSRKTEL